LNLGEKPGFRPVFPRACPKPTGFWNKLDLLIISLQVENKSRNAWSDRTLKRMVREIDNLFTGNDTRDPVIDSLPHPSRRPDIVLVDFDTKTAEVYELKPFASSKGYKHEAAKAQIANYISELSVTALDVKGGEQLSIVRTFPFPYAGKNARITFTGGYFR
jgi:hypothetical protein